MIIANYIGSSLSYGDHFVKQIIVLLLTHFYTLEEY